MNLNDDINCNNTVIEYKKTKLRIAVVGCLHGKLKEVYDTVSKYESNNLKPIDLVLITGDFQSLRDSSDFKYIHIPSKYRKLGDFHKYYDKTLKAPYLTIFIGGNHEASNVLDKFYNGGYICENIYYLGKSGVVNYKGLKIAGLSGIYKEYDYNKGHYENLYNINNNNNNNNNKNDFINKTNNQTSILKTIYHVREYDIAKLNLMSSNIDIFLSHDWPFDVIKQEDKQKILSIKKHWKEEIINNKFGIKQYRYLINLLKPKYWFSSHMHYYYKNNICHNIKTNSYTIFTALDKIIDKNRKWLDIVEIEVNDNTNNSNNIIIDKEWLSICKYMKSYFPYKNDYYDFKNFIMNKNEYNEIQEHTNNNSIKKDIINQDNIVELNNIKDKINENYSKINSCILEVKVNFNDFNINNHSIKMNEIFQERKIKYENTNISVNSSIINLSENIVNNNNSCFNTQISIKEIESNLKNDDEIDIQFY